MAKPKQPRKRKKGASAMFDLGMPTPTIDEVFASESSPLAELAALHRAYCHGSIAALYEALDFCDQPDGPPVQRWMTRAMKRVLEALARGEFAYGPGPGGNPLTREQNYWKHYLRYIAVLQVRSRQHERWDSVLFLREDNPGWSRQEEEHLKKFPDIGRSWTEAYEGAAKLLSQTLAAGSAGAMKRSYLKINRDLKTLDKGANLKLLSKSTRQLFGLTPEKKR